ncbi:GNAT family N-acetyltransferase [Ramlibacter sp. AW1]|uniref:GNAT family N-acetyltransferase n=1 Tax=Ramlibacter aurantiacus TaxID=2801330 RepID=A0A936ZHM5_9BURK|nr:GNAT family N-acetyltransferase [Ramlibacter aurantiacus]MBL0421062.1 GNAT family N-acetyltransferase [Ramlibacter aurantiacus]
MIHRSRSANGKPELWLENDHWWLYAVHPEFAALYARFHQRNRQHLHMAMTQVPELETTEHWVAELPERASTMEAGQAVHLVGFAKSDDSGEIGCLNSYWSIEHGDFQACTISFMLDASLEGRGLMHAAAAAAVREVMSRYHLHRVMATHLPENLRSAKLLRRLGFVVEGYARDFVILNGKWRDNVLLSLLKE